MGIYLSGEMAFKGCRALVLYLCLQIVLL